MSDELTLQEMRSIYPALTEKMEWIVTDKDVYHREGRVWHRLESTPIIRPVS
jgi:hypothetical protein